MMTVERSPTLGEQPHDHPSATDARVLSVIADAGNQRVVDEWLATRYDVVTTDDVAGALQEGTIDLCLLDAAGFDQYRDVLIDYKEAQEPRILPYLLFRKSDTPLLDPDAHQYVDDVIVTPIGKRELARRVETVLRQRELSLQLARKNEQLEYLVGAAAHELRNPLNIAKGYVEQLDDDQPVDRISNALHRMEHLVEDLLTVRRTWNGVTPEDLEPVEFGTLVRECWERLPTENADTRVVAAEAVRIQAVPELVEQLVENLLRNAVEHGGADVTVRAGRLADADGVYVADDGPGIPEEDRESVFEEGYSTGGGNGLGLAIVRRVCDTHEWEIAVRESREGGARFEIRDVVLLDS